MGAPQATCTIRYADNTATASGTLDVAITVGQVYPIVPAWPPPAVPSGPWWSGVGLNFSGSEAHYPARFTLSTSGCPGLTGSATVGDGTGSWAYSGTPQASTSCTVTVADVYGQSVAASHAVVDNLARDVSSIAFTADGQTQDVVVSEAGYAGAFSVDASGCPATLVGSVAPETNSSNTGPSATFRVTAASPASAGTCTLRFADAYGNVAPHVGSANVSVGFAAAPVWSLDALTGGGSTAAPGALNVNAHLTLTNASAVSGSPAPPNMTATVDNGCSVSPSTISGGTGTFSVSSSAATTCTVTVTASAANSPRTLQATFTSSCGGSPGVTLTPSSQTILINGTATFAAGAVDACGTAVGVSAAAPAPSSVCDSLTAPSTGSYSVHGATQGTCTVAVSGASGGSATETITVVPSATQAPAPSRVVSELMKCESGNRYCFNIGPQPSSTICASGAACDYDAEMDVQPAVPPVTSATALHYRWVFFNRFTPHVAVAGSQTPTCTDDGATLFFVRQAYALSWVASNASDPSGNPVAIHQGTCLDDTYDNVVSSYVAPVPTADGVYRFRYHASFPIQLYPNPDFNDSSAFFWDVALYSVLLVWQGP